MKAPGIFEPKGHERRHTPTDATLLRSYETLQATPFADRDGLLRAVAAELDELVEQAYTILSDCGVSVGPTEHEAINQLLRLFESGSGFEARVKAEQLLRPTIDNQFANRRSLLSNP